MKNKIKATEKIKYIILPNYLAASNRETLNILKNKVKKHLKTLDKPIENKVTGFKTNINNKSIGKMLFPAPYFNPFSKEYVTNLNALLIIEEIFQKAIYVDTFKMLKNKDKKDKFHHFVAPLRMNNKNYRVLLTVCEKENGSYLYILNTDLDKDFQKMERDIKIATLVKDLRLYNYQIKDYEYYNAQKMKDKNIINEVKVKYSGC